MPPQWFDQSKKRADPYGALRSAGGSFLKLTTRRLRELFVNNYRLIYRIEPQRIAILAFIHGSRDLKSLWDKRTS